MKWIDKLRVTRIYPGGPAEGKLQVGDSILAINEVPVARDDLNQARRFMPIGTTYWLEVERNGIRQQIELSLSLHRSPIFFSRIAESLFHRISFS